MNTDNRAQASTIKLDGIRSTYIEQIMHDMKNGVMVIDRKGQILYANPQMSLYFEKEELVGNSLNSLVLSNENKANDGFWDVILDAVNQHKNYNQKKLKYVSPSGVKYTFHVTCSYLGENSESDSQGIVITVSDETELDDFITKRHDSTLVLIGMLLLVCMTVFVSELYTFLDGAFPHTWIARSTEILGFVFWIVVLKFTSLTIKDIGIFPVNIKKELLESFLVIFVMVSAMSIGKLVMIANGSSMFPSDTPFFDFTAPPDFYYIKYIAIVIFQEVLTKCGLQKSITMVIDNKNKNAIAITITAVMFMAVHLQHGLIYMIGAGVLSAVLAVLYSRHNSLLGTCLVHYAFGIMGLVLNWIE